MTVYGITATGFEKPSLLDIKAVLEADFRTIYGDDFDLSPETREGHLIALQADREFSMWESMEALYNCLNPDTVSGITQDGLYGINCISRIGATKSIVTAQLEGTAGTTINAGTQFSVTGSPLNIFETLEDVTLVAGANEVQSIDFSAVPTSGTWTLTVGGFTTSAMGYNLPATAVFPIPSVQSVIRALDTSLAAITVTGDYSAGFTLTFAGANAGLRPWDISTATSALLATATPVTIAITTDIEGELQGEVSCEATVTGAVSAPALSLTTIVNSVAGLDTVRNDEAAALGSDAETDEEFRIRRRTRVVTSVSATRGAMRTAVLAINDTEPPALIESCFVQENDTMTATATMNAKSARVVPYYDGAPITDMENRIAQAIYQSKPAGIELMGAQTGVVVGEDGASYTVKWDRPTAVPIYIIISMVEILPDGITAYQIAALKTYIADLGNQLGVGDDVLVWGRDSISDWLNNWTGGDLSNYEIKVGRTAGPTLDDAIVIDDGTNGLVEIATFSTANISITPSV